MPMVHAVLFQCDLVLVKSNLNELNRMSNQLACYLVPEIHSNLFINKSFVLENQEKLDVVFVSR